MSYHAKTQLCSTGNQNGGCDTGNTCSSYCRFRIVAGNGIPTATPTFSMSSNTVGLLRILSDVGTTGKSKIAAVNQKYPCNISACIKDCIEIPMATLTFSVFSNTMGLRRCYIESEPCRTRCRVWGFRRPAILACKKPVQ